MTKNKKWILKKRPKGLVEETNFKLIEEELSELQNGEIVVAVVPVTSLLDLKALSKVAGVKKAKMADVSVAERRTGYVVGGISPFGQVRPHRTFVDDSALLYSEVFVSGGKRGLEVAISPSSFEGVLGATYAPLTGGKNE